MEWRPEDLADLTPELLALLKAWDPTGLVDISPDEYDALTGTILAYLQRSDDVAAFKESFLPVAGEYSMDEGSTEKLYFWFQSKQLGGKDATQRPQLRKGRRWRSSHWKK